nr:MAG: hypothetical protein 2 [Marnaviridae sp.]
MQELNLASVPCPVGAVNLRQVSDNLPVIKPSTPIPIPNRSRLYDKFEYKPQSEEVETSNDAAQSTEEVLTFMEDRMISHVGLDASSTLGDFTTNTDIARFFARPVRTATFTWNESDTVGAKTAYAIWNDWANNAYVKNKLNNYAYMRGDLEVKIQISASPFYYGLMLASYRPLVNFKTDTIAVDGGNRWLIPLSQRPKVWINPQLGDTYSMTLPFIYPLNTVDIQTATELTNMGTLRFDIYSDLDSANGVTGSGITVTVYCSMKNIQLSGASAGYAMQSDEYGDGPVSQPASWVANVAGKLEGIPIIGTFATATRIGASAVSSIARLFGFTNVPVIEPSAPMRPEPFPKFASSEIGFPIEKLTLDPKNELSIDPRIVGLPTGEDELAIRNIVTRESYLTTSSWSTAEAVDTIKFTSQVQPGLGNYDSTTRGQYLVPMAWVGNLFKYWRGDIIFTFRVISSKYHKGKLRISYDPSGNYSNASYNIIGNASTTNTVQTVILDIGETNEVEMYIPYQQRSQFQQLIGQANGVWSTSASPTVIRTPAADNGIITVRVQNVLTAPVASSSVDILVFVRAAPNMEFASPDDIDYTNTTSYFAPQSDVYSSDTMTDQFQAGGKTDTTKNEYLVHFGENILSLRQLLRRYTHLSLNAFPSPSTAGVYGVAFKRLCRMPQTPGYSPIGTENANKVIGVGTAPYNYVDFTPIAYVSNAFLATRGSLNYTFNFADNTPIKSLRAVRDSSVDSTATYGVTTVTTSTINAIARAPLTSIRSGGAGQALTNQLTQSGLNVQFPMYSRFKFHSTNPLFADQGSPVDGSNVDSLIVYAEYPYPGNISDSYLVNTYVGAGTDFSLHYFLNVPTLYLYPSLPTAA